MINLSGFEAVTLCSDATYRGVGWTQLNASISSIQNMFSETLTPVGPRGVVPTEITFAANPSASDTKKVVCGEVYMLTHPIDSKKNMYVVVYYIVTFNSYYSTMGYYLSMQLTLCRSYDPASQSLFGGVDHVGKSIHIRLSQASGGDTSYGSYSQRKKFLYSGTQTGMSFNESTIQGTFGQFFSIGWFHHPSTGSVLDVAYIYTRGMYMSINGYEYDNNGSPQVNRYTGSDRACEIYDINANQINTQTGSSNGWFNYGSILAAGQAVTTIIASSQTPHLASPRGAGGVVPGTEEFVIPFTTLSMSGYTMSMTGEHSPFLLVPPGVRPKGSMVDLPNKNRYFVSTNVSAPMVTGWMGDSDVWLKVN